MKNYRPVSNLNFVSKIIEYSKSNSFTFERNDLSNQYQSAYKKIHSTETALLKVEVLGGPVGPDNKRKRFLEL